jgi:two-component system response regulator YesN
MRLLLADDEPLVIENLLTMMPWKEMGCTVVDTAEDGGEALDKLKSQDIDIVISDIRMPGMGGLELFDAVKEMEKPPALIALTGYDEFEYAQRALRLGVFDYILKPIDYDYLRRAVEKAIEERISEMALPVDPETAALRKLLAGEEASEVEPLSRSAYRILLTWKTELLTAFDEGPVGTSQVETGGDLAELHYLSPDPETSLFLLCYNDVNSIHGPGLGVAEELSSYLRLQAPLLPSRLIFEPEELASAYEATKSELYHLRQEGGSWLHAWSTEERCALVAHRVAKLIEREYQRDLPVSEVAQALGISVSYLSESVRKVFGVTFVALLTSVRLRHARRALRQTEASVAQIASMVGYRDYRYFARVFRENVGRPPSEYRRSAS